ncbi:hypothetical protein NPIL_136261 [Nephila pilipes]|uniref:Uncharacterized protein n=1 Tax=Nephila pilipes TaxID=299642 RepID=A0A8X6TR20_NEPPI|nr:hypothetical protein NPIL_136261 [Nephila pilipes]
MYSEEGRGKRIPKGRGLASNSDWNGKTSQPLVFFSVDIPSDAERTSMSKFVERCERGIHSSNILRNLFESLRHVSAEEVRCIIYEIALNARKELKVPNPEALSEIATHPISPKCLERFSSTYCLVAALYSNSEAKMTKENASIYAARFVEIMETHANLTESKDDVSAKLQAIEIASLEYFRSICEMTIEGNEKVAFYFAIACLHAEVDQNNPGKCLSNVHDDSNSSSTDSDSDSSGSDGGQSESTSDSSDSNESETGSSSCNTDSPENESEESDLFESRSVSN